MGRGRKKTKKQKKKTKQNKTNKQTNNSLIVEVLNSSSRWHLSIIREKKPRKFEIEREKKKN